MKLFFFQKIEDLYHLFFKSWKKIYNMHFEQGFEHSLSVVAPEKINRQNCDEMTQSFCF